MILLKRNTESVLTAAGECDLSIGAKRLERAVKHKDLLERDAIFLELSRERSRAARECMLKKMPSLKRLVDLLCQELRPA